MGSDGAKIQDLYDLRIKDWKKSLALIERKLSRHLDRADLKYALRYRVKKIDSLREKLSRSSPEGKRRNKRIQDLLGVRVIVPFLGDVEKVIVVVESQFDVLEIERKAEHLSFREFAYDSVHLTIALPNRKTLQVPPGCAKTCEIQIRTTLQDAWAEIEHEIIYKSSLEFPDTSVWKKLAALNATLALSDTIFQEIRDYQSELTRWGRQRFHELSKKAAFADSTALPKVSGRKDATVLHRKGRLGGDAALESTLQLALKAHNEKEYQTAIRLYSRALTMRPDMKIRSIIYNHRGMANFMLQRENQALRDFDKSAQCDPRSYQALNNRALIWRRMGHVQECLRDFSRSLEIKAGQPEVHYMRAQTLLEIGDTAAALREVEAALNLRKVYPEAEQLRDRIRRFRRA